MLSILLEYSDGLLMMVVVLGLFIAAYLLYERRNVNSGRKLPPSLPSIPIVGSLPFMPTRLEDLVALGIAPGKKPGKVFSFHAGSKYDFFWSC